MESTGTAFATIQLKLREAGVGAGDSVNGQNAVGVGQQSSLGAEVPQEGPKLHGRMRLGTQEIFETQPDSKGNAGNRFQSGLEMQEGGEALNQDEDGSLVEWKVRGKLMKAPDAGEFGQDDACGRPGAEEIKVGLLFWVAGFVDPNEATRWNLTLEELSKAGACSRLVRHGHGVLEVKHVAVGSQDGQPVEQVWLVGRDEMEATGRHDGEARAPCGGS